jgi:hypothetical protein
LNELADGVIRRSNPRQADSQRRQGVSFPPRKVGQAKRVGRNSAAYSAFSVARTNGAIRPLLRPTAHSTDSVPEADFWLFVTDGRAGSRPHSICGQRPSKRSPHERQRYPGSSFRSGRRFGQPREPFSPDIGLLIRATLADKSGTSISWCFGGHAASGLVTPTFSKAITAAERSPKQYPTQSM